MNLRRALMRTGLAGLALALPATLIQIPTAGAVAAAVNGADQATVERIVDGDTIDVRLQGARTRVRFLQVNTPELGGCLYDEATAFTAGALPVGSTVSLAYDVGRVDRFGRTLAYVTSASGVDMSRALAARGLGLPFFANPNRGRYTEMEAVANGARRSGVGLFDARIACTPAHDLRTAKNLRTSAARTKVGTTKRYQRALKRLRSAERTLGTVHASNYGLMSFWVDDVLAQARTAEYRQVRRVRAQKKRQRKAVLRRHQ